MELTNEFTVPLPPERAWSVLTDLERIAPCVPGARLTEIDGDDHKGELKVKVGPITATYEGVARFSERDADAKRAVLRAAGSDARQGDASATITATLAPDGDGTKVVIATELALAGKVAQFGRGVLADVSVKVLEEFVECLGDQLEAEHEVGELAEGADLSPAVKEFAKAVVEAAPQTDDQEAGPDGRVARKVDTTEPEALDLLGTAGPSVLKRLLPGVVVVAALLLLLLWRRRR